MLFPETENRTIRVPLQWIDGQWQIEGGGELPKVSEKACADLVMPASFLVDEDEIRQWTSEAEVDLLDEGTELFMRVNPNNVPQKCGRRAKRRTIHSEPPVGSSVSFSGNHCE